MLFNSYEFLFLFLPITLLGFYLARKFSNPSISIAWLVIASLFFYGWWNPIYLILISFSILFNFTMGRIISSGEKGAARTKYILGAGIAVNLTMLAYFKYTIFLVANFNNLFDTEFLQSLDITLPLAISFFTFQQIAYLVDAYHKDQANDGFLEYILFVTFFPQLIAGPIVHHRQLLPQFQNIPALPKWSKNIAIGLTIFGIGLFKKLVLADNLAIYANPVFDTAEQDVPIAFIEAWGGALAYTFQLYFDFSGYADMAIGLAKLFGINLPLNFLSPYKSFNIIEFWRRWHITLSSFLRDYLYIPLGGGRSGKARKLVNLFLTMFLGGIWHGAGWTFILWGTMHGIYLVVNNVFRKIYPPSESSYFRKYVSGLLTFFAVVVAWVLFRSSTLDGAVNILAGMFFLNDIVLPMQLHFIAVYLPDSITFSSDYLGVFGSALGLMLIGVSFPIVWMLPSTHEYLGRYSPAIQEGEFGCSKKQIKWMWQPSYFNALLISVAISTAFIILLVGNETEFLYFQF